MVEIKNSHNLAVDYLKFLAVCFIIVDHTVEILLGFSWPMWFLGAAGVSIFVYVSGYLAYQSNTARVFQPKQYILGRFLKLFPLFLLASVLMFGFHGVTDTEHLIKNLALIFQSDSAFWFVPMILLMYIFYTVSRAYPRVFPLLAAAYFAYFGYVIISGLVIGAYASVVTTGIYWPLLFLLFFKGVYTKQLNINLPKNLLVQTVSSYSYPIYLFQNVFIGSILVMGAFMGCVYVGLAVGCFTVLKMKVNK